MTSSKLCESVSSSDLPQVVKCLDRLEHDFTECDYWTFSSKEIIDRTNMLDQILGVPVVFCQNSQSPPNHLLYDFPWRRQVPEAEVVVNSQDNMSLNGTHY